MRFSALNLNSAQKFLLSAAAAAALVLASTPISAQDQDDIPNAGRLGYISGNVSIEPAGVDTWGQAYPNLPLGPGDRIFTDETGRAEIQVGQTYIRIGPNTDVTLVNENDLSIALGLAQGSIHVRVMALWQDQALQVHTANANITSFGASDFRVDAFPDQDSSVYTSFAQPVGVTAPGGFSEHVAGGQSLEISGSNPPYPQWLQPAEPDDLDNWSRGRDRQLTNANSYRYVSPNIPGAGELDGYGDWEPGTDYGSVWFPRDVPAGWAPYRYGHWVNHAPWGWMWVEDEPWGYAPFHYGRWVSMRGRWGWIPGPPAERPIFAPALVVFAGGIQFGGVGVSVWIPLGPGEAYRPWYPCQPRYVDRVNITNITETRIVHVQKTYVNIVNVTNVTYVNRTNGVSAMNHNDFAAGHSAVSNAVRVDPHQLEHIRVIDKPEPKPVAASFVARPPAHAVTVKTERPVLMNADGKLQAAKPGAKPVDPPVKPVVAPKQLPGRTVVAPPPGSKVPPPPPPGKSHPEPAKLDGRPTPPAAPPARPSAPPVVEPKPVERPISPPPGKVNPPEAVEPKPGPKPGPPPPQHPASPPAVEPKPGPRPGPPPPPQHSAPPPVVEPKPAPRPVNPPPGAGPEEKQQKPKPPVKPDDKNKPEEKNKKTPPEKKPE